MVVPLCRDGEEERRRENRPVREVGDVVVGGGEVVLCEEKRPEERVWGRGSGEGSRRDPKRGIVVAWCSITRYLWW